MHSLSPLLSLAQEAGDHGQRAVQKRAQLEGSWRLGAGQRPQLCSQLTLQQLGLVHCERAVGMSLSQVKPAPTAQL